ncbi:MAG TPA: hypothetical protein VG870_08710 [Chitinophagaceae bacterium]|nr:hypothetical protein [Chitinophagaceae bacterium]
MRNPVIPADRPHPLRFLPAILLFFSVSTWAHPAGQPITFTVSMEHPENHRFQVEMRCTGLQGTQTEFKMPAWSPGYYQIMDYARNVSGFRATDPAGHELSWRQTSLNTWAVNHGPGAVILHYDVEATRHFVATSVLDSTHGYLVPTGVLLYVKNQLALPVRLQIRPAPGWHQVATGLDSLKGAPYTFTAPNFDVLYDSPLLIGNLEYLPPFYIRGVPHRFVGIQLGEFDRDAFLKDLKEVVEAGVNIIGDIPYRQYTFLAIGPGQGGIEHLNSTTVSFSGNGLQTPGGRLRMLHFLAHEYFHHYNVKRIRPIELGPFDYDKGSPTRMLWVAEGLTVYYEYLMVQRAGLSTLDELLGSFQQNIRAYENKPGHLFQSLVQASYDTWSDGPFGRTGDDINKTISYYDKGPAVGLLLDFAIRHASHNRHSLDDVMRILYHEYYQVRKRGYTEAEFRQVCEKEAGTDLSDLFDYTTTVKPVDYPRYLAYGGIAIDTSLKRIAGSYLGLAARPRGDSLLVTAVDWPSAAWDAGLRPRSVLLQLDGRPAIRQSLDDLLRGKKPGDSVVVVYRHDGEQNQALLPVFERQERSFSMAPVPQPDALQSAILKSWLGNRSNP